MRGSRGAAGARTGAVRKYRTLTPSGAPARGVPGVPPQGVVHAQLSGWMVHAACDARGRATWEAPHHGAHAAGRGMVGPAR
jgi:hypothetical protein